MVTGHNPYLLLEWRGDLGYDSRLRRIDYVEPYGPIGYDSGLVLWQRDTSLGIGEEGGDPSRGPLRIIDAAPDPIGPPGDYYPPFIQMRDSAFHYFPRFPGREATRMFFDAFEPHRYWRPEIPRNSSRVFPQGLSIEVLGPADEEDAYIVRVSSEERYDGTLDSQNADQ